MWGTGGWVSKHALCDLPPDVHFRTISVNDRSHYAARVWLEADIAYTNVCFREELKWHKGLFHERVEG